MRDDKLLATGIVGSTIVALCCFTPLLVIALGIVGFGAAVAWLDMVLLPALGLFILITLYALARRRRQRK